MTVCLISSHYPCNYGSARFTPLNIYLINNVEDIAVFLVLKVFDSDTSYMFSSTVESNLCLL